MTYDIKPRTYKIAEKLGVKIYPSDNPKYKLEIYDANGQFITYSGDANYKDYPTYLEMEKKGEVPKGYADKRRKLYKIRHQKDRSVKGSAGWYADKLLW